MADNVLSELRSLADNAEKVQNDLLLSIIKKNADTEYGRRLDFAHVESFDDYQMRAPLTDWEDYEDSIGRMMKGEKNVLTSDDIKYYCISSGTTDQPKYVPLTEEDIRIQKKYWIDGVGECIDYFLRQRGEDTSKRIFSISEFFMTNMDDGTMSGVRAGAPFRVMEREGDIDVSMYTAPKEVLFPEKLEDMLYMKLRFALADPEVTAIHGIFVHKIVGLFDYMIKNWQALINDIASGTVSPQFNISDEWKRYLEEKLPPDRRRATDLQSITVGDGSSLALKIWPKLKYVCVAGGSLFMQYMEPFRKYIGNLPLHYFVYATSESNLGMSLKVNDDDAYYVLLPDAAVFEFIPTTGHMGRPLKAWELEKDGEYELVVTTLSGLYRYAVQDIVKVVDFFGNMPVIGVCYRKNQVMNLVNENVTTRQLEAAARRLGELMGTKIAEYCVGGDSDSEGRLSYIMYIETGMGRSNNDKKCSEIIDNILKESSSGYKKAREEGRLNESRVVSLKRGSFRSYGAYLAQQGYRMEQNKPLRIMTTEDQKQFFRKKAEQL